MAGNAGELIARPRSAGRAAFLPLLCGLIALAWLALALWDASPYGRYLAHGDTFEVGALAEICRALPQGKIVVPALTESFLLLRVSLSGSTDACDGVSFLFAKKKARPTDVPTSNTRPPTSPTVASSNADHATVLRRTEPTFDRANNTPSAVPTTNSPNRPAGQRTANQTR